MRRWRRWAASRGDRRPDDRRRLRQKRLAHHPGGPAPADGPPVNLRLGEGGHVIYSTLDAIYTPPWREKFLPIERTYDVGIIYGTRHDRRPLHRQERRGRGAAGGRLPLQQGPAEPLQGRAVQEVRHPLATASRGVWEYEEYVRLAEPGFEALKAIGCNGGRSSRWSILAHEYMGMPAGAEGGAGRLAQHADGLLRARGGLGPARSSRRTPATTRCSTTSWPGRRERRQDVEDVFPAVHDNYKHPLVKAARYCDHVFAVGDYVERSCGSWTRTSARWTSTWSTTACPSLPLTLAEKQRQPGADAEVRQEPLRRRADVDLHARRPPGAEQGRSGATCACCTSWSRCWRHAARRPCTSCSARSAGQRRAAGRPPHGAGLRLAGRARDGLPRPVRRRGSAGRDVRRLQPRPPGGPRPCWSTSGTGTARSAATACRRT